MVFFLFFAVRGQFELCAEGPLVASLSDVDTPMEPHKRMSHWLRLLPIVSMLTGNFLALNRRVLRALGSCA